MTFSLWHLLIVIIVIIASIWPVAKILRRAGFSGWWAILSVIPLVNYIALWVFAVSRWPATERRISN
jgi:hypothetical protein